MRLAVYVGDNDILYRETDHDFPLPETVTQYVEEVVTLEKLEDGYIFSDFYIEEDDRPKGNVFLACMDSFIRTALDLA